MEDNHSQVVANDIQDIMQRTNELKKLTAQLGSQKDSDEFRNRL
jgi:hypothetical protein